MFHWYGLIIGIAAVVWWSITEHLEPRLKKIIPIILVISLIGARAYHIVEYWEYYQTNSGAILKVWEGGLSIWGAIIVGGGYLWYTVHSTRYTVEERNNYWSALITPLPLAQAIGRVANGVNGEFTGPVLGIPWWGMEAAMDLVLFGIIWNIKKEWRAGMYIFGYGLIRLALQPYR